MTGTSKENMQTQLSAASASSTLVSSGLDENIVVTHPGAIPETTFIQADDSGQTYTIVGDEEGGDTTIRGVTYEVSITGGAGDDVFIAESGNSIVSGEGGSDTYIWKTGNLLINQQGVTETVETIIIDNPAVTLSDFLFFPANTHTGVPGTNDMEVFVIPTGDKITFTDQFLNFNGGTAIEKTVLFQINDGPVLEFKNFDEWVFTYNSDDVLTGQTVFADGGNDTVTGTLGDDILSGGADNDSLNGLAGSDYLDGGLGDDVFVHHFESAAIADYYVAGSGSDVLEFHISQTDFDTADIRNELYALQNHVSTTADPTIVNGPAFQGGFIGLTTTGFEVVDVYVDGILTEVTPIIVDVPPELAGTGNVDSEISEILIEFTLDPRPQDFPDLTEGKRLSPEELINGTNRANLIFDNAHQVDVNFISESAGYRNALGSYTVGVDGMISNIKILTENASGAGRGLNGGGDFTPGELIADLGTLAAGTEIGFFIVANGYNMNNQFRNIDFNDGELNFVHGNGDTDVNIHDSFQGTELVFTDSTGQAIELKGNVYHASSLGLNGDGIEHSVSGVDEDGNLRISFEDLKNQGDADYDDLVIALDVVDAVDTALHDFAIASDFSIADTDDGMLASMMISISGGLQNGDRIMIDESLLTDAGISLAVGADGSLSLSGEASIADYETVLNSLTFGNAYDSPDAGARTVTVEITDIDGLSDNADITVMIHEAGALAAQDVLQADDMLYFGEDASGAPESQSAPPPPDINGGLTVDDVTPPPVSDF